MFVSNKEAFIKNFKDFFLLILKWLSVIILIKVAGVGFEKVQLDNLIEVISILIFVPALISLALSLYVDYTER